VLDLVEVQHPRDDLVELATLPDLLLDPAAPYPSTNGVAFRSPAALPVEFTPA
jgi:hypothetical protein